MFSIGGAMGMTPQEVKECSLWEFKQAVAGYVKANSAGDGEASAPTPAELEAAIAAVAQG